MKKGTREKDLTPLMRQYLAIKREHPDCILLYRMGDFYEMFMEDAETGAKELDITLTSRDKGPYGGRMPLAGIPYHALDNYLPRLVKKGYKVAIAEQVEDPRKAKGLVKREVIRIVTPGTLISSGGEHESGNNFLSAVVRRVSEDNRMDLPLKEDRGLSENRVVLPAASYGVAHLDISTGDFYATEIDEAGSFQGLVSELLKYGPAEVVLPDSLLKKGGLTRELRSQIGEGVALTSFPDHHFLENYATDLVKRQFGVVSLKGFGLEGMPLALEAAGGVLAYAREHQMCDLSHLRKISTYRDSQFMVLDSTTLRNLEVNRSCRDGSARGSLLEVLDQTSTSMGSRMLRNWVQHPLMGVEDIRERQEGVGLLHSDLFLRADLRDNLKGIQDLERLLMRLSLGRGNARDLRGLKNSLEHVRTLKERMMEIEGLEKVGVLKRAAEGMDPEEDVMSLIDAAIVEEPPLSTKDGGMIREGYSGELDEIKEASRGSREWLKRFEETERKRTGVRSLKVRYNNVFGYYIEVTKANLDLVPPDYIRKQTLTNAERFITEELKEKETIILNARERMAELECQLLNGVIDRIVERMSGIQETSRNVAILDVLLDLAEVAVKRNYTRPRVLEDGGIEIKGGRHPVIEDRVEWGFVPNDVLMGGGDSRFIILTGPNMAGKSTYMRQLALIVIMAQMGSFVPAERARVGIVDRIFTRVGASDDLVRGQSTFMVEMLELANILNCATSRSLILLDEVGRGTSTFDGLAIAWAVTEFLSDPDRISAKTLFATHYHHLTELEGALKGVVNYHMSVKEEPGGITFLRKVRRGAASGSYGIEVARLAGIPEEVVTRAHEILSLIEKSDYLEGRAGKITTGEVMDLSEPPIRKRDLQMVLFPVEDGPKGYEEDPIKEELRSLDPDNLTPLSALELLYRLKKRALQ